MTPHSEEMYMFSSCEEFQRTEDPVCLFKRKYNLRNARDVDRTHYKYSRATDNNTNPMGLMGLLEI